MNAEGKGGAGSIGRHTGRLGGELRQNVRCPSHFVSHPRTNVSLPSENVRRPSQNVDPPSNYVRSPSNYVCLPIMFLGLLGCGVSGFWNGGGSSWDRGAEPDSISWTERGSGWDKKDQADGNENETTEL